MPGDSARVVFWNAERGRHLDAMAALLAGQGAAVNLLCEMDLGMARSFQRHTARDLADRLGQGYAFAVEFLELELGDTASRRAMKANTTRRDSTAAPSCRRMSCRDRC